MTQATQMTQTKTVDTIIQEMRDEAKRLKGEYERIFAALAAINGKQPVGRPKGTGGTQQRIITQVRSRPGSTILELAKALDVAAPYLYRALPTLEEQGKVRAVRVNKKVRWYPGDES